ncbi:MAG: YigZ family protein [Clostridia bacterium]|nr:YigZ family protein [Clostridia bacterium]
MAERKILTVQGETESEKIIEKSRFITYSTHVESEEEARAFIAKIRSAHSLATHVCYAFISDKLGNLCRFSDDGEPQGTAGMPILDVIKNKGLYETAVAVVRFFGGVKLGAGGLVRAYSSSASENLAIANICSVEICTELCVLVDYTGIDGVQKFVSANECELLTTEYGEKVAFQLLVKKAGAEKFIQDLVDFMQGRVEIKITAEYFSAFKL